MTEHLANNPEATKLVEGEVMTQLTKERVKVAAGSPVFGTVVLDADHIVYLNISDDLLHQRTTMRGTSFEDAKNMQTHIKKEMTASGLPVTEFEIC